MLSLLNQQVTVQSLSNINLEAIDEARCQFVASIIYEVYSLKELFRIVYSASPLMQHDCLIKI